MKYTVWWAGNHELKFEIESETPEDAAIAFVKHTSPGLGDGTVEILVTDGDNTMHNIAVTIETKVHYSVSQLIDVEPA